MPLSRVAPTITGRATVRESMFACSRVKRRAPGGGERGAVSRDPGDQRCRLSGPEREPVERARVAGPALLRSPIGGDHPNRAQREAHGGRRRAAEALLDHPLVAIADDRRRHEGEADDEGAPGVEGGKLGGDHAPLADQERGRGTRVQRHLEALALLGILTGRLPAREPRRERDVGGARDGEQLRRALDQPEDRRPPGPHLPSAGATGSTVAPSPGPLRLRIKSQMRPPTMAARTT